MAYTDWRQKADEGWKAKGEQKYSRNFDDSEPLPPKPDPDFDHAVKQSERYWRDCKDHGSSMWKLRMAVAHMANLDRNSEGSTFYAAAVDELKGTVASLLRTANAADVLGEPRVRELVMTFFGEAGIERLRVRAATQVAA